MHLTTPMSAMDLAARRDARTFSRAMLLKGGPKSPEAAAFVDQIVETILIPWKAAQGGQVRPSAIRNYRTVTGRFLADLMLSAANGQWSKRETNTNGLTGIPGGATGFRDFRAAMGSAGLLEELPGYVRKFKMFGIDQVRAARTSFRPSLTLLSMAEDAGVTLAVCRAHFGRGQLSPPSLADLVQRRDAKVTKGARAKVRPIANDDLEAARIVGDLQRLNTHLLAKGRVAGIAFAGLRRLFSNADMPGFAWQWHGRYYSMPDADDYENLEGGSATRKRLIRIDGKPAVEVDISAAHLTILHGLLGLPSDGTEDPYLLPEEPGAPPLDRGDVKAWLVLALGASDSSIGGRRHNKARQAALIRYPFLKDLPQLGISPLDLQFHEAEILRLAMEDLMSQGLGFLPIHDALIVAKGNQAMAAEAIRAAFKRYFRDHLGMASAPVPRIKGERMAEG